MAQISPRNQTAAARSVAPRAPERAAPALRPAAADAARCQLAMQLAAHRFDASRAMMLAHGRGSRRASVARQVAIYLAHVTLGVPIGPTARQFRRHRSTAAFACHQVEDRRDEPAFDVAVADLELAIRVLLEVASEVR